jgi:methyl-accepting chemotaxis protein
MRVNVSAKAYMLLSNGAIVAALGSGLAVVGVLGGGVGEAGGGVLLALGFVGMFLHRLRLARFYARVLVGLRGGGALLAGTAREISEATRRTAATSAEQAATMMQTAATVEQLATTARAIADRARTVANASSHTAKTMLATDEAVEAIAQRSVDLGNQSQRIHEILALISEIAEQTNLLALNAAIEAARAGDAGKGFAVVAAEIRKLAERSLESTESIRLIVEAIDAETNRTILATEHGARQAREVVALLEHADPLLEESVRATEQQEGAAEQVAAAILQIREAATSLVGEQERLTASAGRVGSLVDTLRTLEAQLGAGDGASIDGAIRRSGNFWIRDARESGSCVALVVAAAALFALGGGLLPVLLGAAGLSLLLAIRFYRARWLFELSSTLRTGVTDIASTVTELRTAVATSGAAAAQQSSAVGEMTATVEELAATAVSIAEGTRSAAAAAQETEVMMAETDESVAAIRARALELGKRAVEIGAILHLIGEVSEQTNLLALNAAIEAARAGEAGKGFAVVAGEVRNLAERSLEATESIAAIVTAIQEEAQKMISAADEGVARSRDVAELMDQTTPMLDESIHATAQQQAAAAQVAAALSQFSGTAEQLAADVAAHAPNADRLDELVAELESTLRVYRVDSGAQRADARSAAAVVVAVAPSAA